MHVPSNCDPNAPVSSRGTVELVPAMELMDEGSLVDKWCTHTRSRNWCLPILTGRRTSDGPLLVIVVRHGDDSW